jgi:DNA-binding ferritin-like protein
MIKLATQLRYMQFYAHNAHNLCQGDTFFADHEELGDLYGVYEGLYDSVIERMIGLGQSVDLVKIQVEAAKMLDSEAEPKAFSSAFSGLLTCEHDLCKVISDANEGASLGTQDLLQAMCNESEVRQYKFKQRLNKSASSSSTSSENKTEEKTEEKTDTKEATTKSKPPVFKLITGKK